MLHREFGASLGYVRPRLENNIYNKYISRLILTILETPLYPLDLDQSFSKLRPRVAAVVAVAAVAAVAAAPRNTSDSRAFGHSDLFNSGQLSFRSWDGGDHDTPV